MTGGFTYNLVNGMGSTISYTGGVQVDDVPAEVVTLRNYGAITTTIS